MCDGSTHRSWVTKDDQFPYLISFDALNFELRKKQLDKKYIRPAVTHAVCDTINVYHHRGTPSPRFGEINMPSIGHVVGFPYTFLFVKYNTTSRTRQRGTAQPVWPRGVTAGSLRITYNLYNG